MTMGMITVRQTGDFRHIEGFFRKTKEMNLRRILKDYAEEGVRALSSATPVDTGKTASSWTYEITVEKGDYRIDWINTNVNKGINIALILQTGHGTRNGGWVEGRDYINPALQPVFDKIAEEVWGEVTRA